MKDDYDNLTLELPLLELPLQVLERYLRKWPSAPKERDWIRIQHWEKVALRTGDLEMLIGCREWRKKQRLMNDTKRLML